MNKSKLVKKAGNIQLVIKSQKGQQLDEREVYAINNEGVPGLLYFTIEQKNGSFKLVYDLTGFITLRELLKNPLRRETFTKILQNIFDNLKAMQSMNFRQQKLYLDFDHVMVNPATQNLYFVYLPIQSFENGISLRDFLLNIIQLGAFEADEDRSYVKKYIAILNDGINFSVFELEQYIHSLAEEGKTENQKNKCPKCHMDIALGTKFCPACGTLLGEKEEGNRSKIIDPWEALHDKQEEEKEQWAEYRDSKGNTQNFTTVLGADDDISQPGVTSVLGVESMSAPVYPYLIRKINSEKIRVDKPAFRIGKERNYCDYFVSDNSAVSRSHANIVTKNKRYYVVDLNSTNHTYVDDRLIQPQQEVEIFSGTRIRLGNEEFTFYIET